MASLVVKAMQQDGVKILMGCEPKFIYKNENSGRLSVGLMTPNKKEMCDQFDTVLMAAGKLYHYARVDDSSVVIIILATRCTEKGHSRVIMLMRG